MRLVLPRLYVILDATLLNNSPYDCAQELAAAGVRLLQYRDKWASARDLLKTSGELVSSLNSYGCSLIVNDRPDVAALACAAGGAVGPEKFGSGRGACWSGRKDVRRCVHAQSGAVSSRVRNLGGLHCCRAHFCHYLQSKSRSCRRVGVDPPGASAHA